MLLSPNSPPCLGEHTCPHVEWRWERHEGDFEDGSSFLKFNFFRDSSIQTNFHTHKVFESSYGNYLNPMKIKANQTWLNEKKKIKTCIYWEADGTCAKI